MKIVMTSDTHENLDVVRKVTGFAKDNGIKTIVDCGDLHKHIQAYSGIDLHAVYWEKASGAMDRWNFTNGIQGINGTMHENGSLFHLDNAVFYIQHNLAEYEDIIPEEAWNKAKASLESAVEGEKKFIAFGHTHNFHYNNEDGIIAVNPGSLGLGEDNAFVVLDTETGELEYRNLEKTILKIGSDFDFSRVRSLYNSRDCTRFIGRLKSSGKEVIVTGNQRTAEHKEIKSIEAMIDGVPLYTAVQDNGHIVLVKNGEIVAGEYKNILSVCTRRKDDKVVGVEAFSAVKDNGRQVYVLEDGTESREFYELAEFKGPFFVDGKLCFVAKNSEKGKDLVILGDKTVGQYKSVSAVVPLEDKVAVIVNKQPKKQQKKQQPWGGKTKQYVNYAGQNSKLYDKIDRSNVSLVDGRLAFIASEKDESFVVHAGVEGSRFEIKGYDSSISQLTDINGIPAYVVKQDKKQFIVHGDFRSEPVNPSGWDSGYFCLADVGGKIGCILKKDGQSQVIIDGKVVREGKGILGFKQLSTGEIAYRHSGQENSFVEVNGKEFRNYNRLETFVESYSKGEVKLED